MQMLNSVSLVLPLYNEIEYIRIMVPQAVSILSSMGLDYEIIIVDDASNDGSEFIADEFSRTNNRIISVHHEENKKLGATLKSGFARATKEVVIYTDMDMPYDLNILRKLLPLMNENDVIYGRRIGREISLKRLVYSKCYNLLVRIVFGVKINDFNFSLKIFKRRILKELDLKSDGSFISAEILIKSSFLKYRMLETPVYYNLRKYGESHLSSFSVILKILLEMLMLYPEIESFKK